MARGRSMGNAMMPAVAQGPSAKALPFDVIIIGQVGGSALAYRLSANADTRVLLLEAGPASVLRCWPCPRAGLNSVGSLRLCLCDVRRRLRGDVSSG